MDTSLSGARVARVLDQVISERATPTEIVMDNGPELTSKVLDQWAYDRGVRLRFIALVLTHSRRGPSRICANALRGAYLAGPSLRGRG